MNKTKDYDMFIFREDNRSKIDYAHVEKIKNSIKSKNMLELRPILVNEKMEIIDGQHRLLAAKGLDIEIYYVIEKDLRPADIVLMNISKAWQLDDFLNFYVKNDFPEYVKLKKFVSHNILSLKVALALQQGLSNSIRHEFKIGNYKYLDTDESIIQTCKETIEVIKRRNGFSGYTASSKFWMSMIKLFIHPKFEARKWFSNLVRMVDDCGPRSTTIGYQKMILDIYNWRNNSRIEIVKGDPDEESQE